MTNYEIYTFFLCLIVFILLTGLFVTMLSYIVKLILRIIRNGLDDEKIKEEYNKENSKFSRFIDSLSKWFSILLSSVFILFFICALAITYATDKPTGNIPTLKVVSSASMSERYKDNDYLFENNLNDQFDTFDIIFVYELPKEEEIELYDIIVYEVEKGVLLSHRVVAIEEPNEKHPDCRHFTLQGDAVKNPDKGPVLYSQMRGIYNGQRIQYIGSFVLFLQSPAGYLCLVLILFYLIATPIVERIIIKEKMKRLLSNGVIDDEEIEKVVDVNEPFISPFEFRNRDNRSFKEKLFEADPILKNRYCKIANCLYTIDKINGRDSHKFETFKSGGISVAKMSIRGKTLNVYLGLNPSDYIESKYIFTDESGKKTYINFPMRVKVTSDRKAKWVNELLIDLANKNNLKINDKPSKEITIEDLKPIDVIAPNDVMTQQIYEQDKPNDYEFVSDDTTKTIKEEVLEGYIITRKEGKNIRIRNFFIEYLNDTEPKSMNLVLSVKDKKLKENVFDVEQNNKFKPKVKVGDKVVVINSFIVEYLNDEPRLLDLEMKLCKTKNDSKLDYTSNKKLFKTKTKIDGKYVSIGSLVVEIIDRNK